MFIPRKLKKGHFPTVVSRKSVNRFIDCGLRVISAKPFLHFHQTLTFPSPVVNAKAAKLVFHKFAKGVLKFYQGHELAFTYVQERRKRDRTIHFHLCFLFFGADKLPYCPSRMRRDFRTDIFNRWNALNDGKAVHPANTLEPHEFNQDTLKYFARALIVDETSTRRGETSWCGVFNKQLILSRCTTPTKQQRKAVFDGFFKKCRSRAAVNMPDRAASLVQPVASVVPLAVAESQALPPKELADYAF
jgi:hypothetical protein